MDKYEFKLKLDQMKTLAGNGEYETAAALADSINWRKVKNINLLIKAGEVYAKTGRYEEAKEILLMAYDRSPIGRMIIYRLAEISIKMKNFAEAEEYYDEFVEIAPRDNLRFVLRYKISKAKGMDVRALIVILEELKEVEYSEEWAYELACLYHQAGESEKCINACDELILWFGDGIYVERALELKMLYQPLTKLQEDKYRALRQHRDGVKEVYPYGEKQIADIPVVQENPDKYNTANLQEELAKSMQQIMDATEKGAVDDTMDNIKKMVEEIPYLQMPVSETESKDGEHIQTDKEIDGSLNINFKEMLAEEYDGQLGMMVKGRLKEPQVNGQMSIEDVLSEWEKTRRAAESALKLAEQQRLESAKARALQEAGDLMEQLQLTDAMPNSEDGMTPSQLIQEKYLSADGISDEAKAGEFIAGMNNVLQQEIDRLQEEAAGEHELLRKIRQAKPNFDDQIGIRSYIPDEFGETEEASEEQAEEMADAAVQEDKPLPEIALPDDIASALMKQDTREIRAEKITEALEAQVESEEIQAEDAAAGKRPPITKLSEEQKTIFSYFVPVAGMEQQICQVLTGASARLAGSTNSSAGNILIQGGSGCGKTVLATGLIKALQKEVKRPNGKIGKIDAAALNKKDVSALLKKVAGGCLIIERAGELSRETAVKLSLLLESDSSGLLVIMEDTRVGLDQALGRDEGLAKKFTERIKIPVFTSDELVAFGKAYAHDLDYEIDAMGVLALYNRISNIQRLDRATTLTEVKEIIDEAIQNAEKKSLKKALSIITSRRYTEDDYVILREKDFEE